MLLFENRLKKGKDFEDVYKKGRKAFFGVVFLKFRKNGKEASRVGFSVGNKFSKNATERNRIKRQMREVFRENMSGIKKGFDIVVVPKKEQGGTIDFERVAASIKKALSIANLLK